MPSTVTARQAVAAIGGLLTIAGLWVLLWPISVTMDTGPLGLSEQISCGSALITHDVYGPLGRAACADSLAGQRGYGWPVLLAGLLLAGAAMLVQVSPPARDDV